MLWMLKKISIDIQTEGGTTERGVSNVPSAAAIKFKVMVLYIQFQ